MQSETDVLNHYVSLYIAGNRDAIAWWEALCTSEPDEKFWGLLLPAVAVAVPVPVPVPVVDPVPVDVPSLGTGTTAPEHVQFLLLVVSRRVSTKGIPDAFCVQAFATLVRAAASPQMSRQCLQHVASCAAKILLCSSLSPGDFTSQLQGLFSFRQTAPIAVAAVLNGLSLHCGAIDHTRKAILSEASSVLVEMVACLLKNGAADDSLMHLASDCINHWLSANLPSSIALFTSVNSILNTSIVEFIVHYASHGISTTQSSATLLQFADFCECLLTLRSDSISLFHDSDDGPAMSSLVDPIINSNTAVDPMALFDQIAVLCSSTLGTQLNVISAQLTVAAKEDNEDDEASIAYSIATVRIVVAVIKLLRSQIAADQHTSLLSALMHFSGHRALAVSALALEGVLDTFKQIPKARRLSEVVRQWSDAIFARTFERIKRCTQSSDDDSDVDEWRRIREQICVDVAEECYVSLRSTLLQNLESVISQALESDPASSEAAYFVLRSLSISISKRALLFGASQTAVSNARRAAQTDGLDVEKDAELTTHCIFRLFQSTFAIYKAVNPQLESSRSLLNPFVVIEICRAIGSYSAWISKSKNANANQLLVNSLEFVVTAIQLPCYSGFAAASAMRSLCSYNGGAIAATLPGCLDYIVDTWAQHICSLPHSFPLVTRDDPVAIYVHHQLYEDMTTRNQNNDSSDWQFDEVLEIKKAFMQSMCAVLKHVSEETFQAKVTLLVDPLIQSFLIDVSRTSATAADASILMSKSHENYLAGLVECLAIFIRSVRTPLLVKSLAHQRTSDSRSTSEDLASHPAMSMIASWGLIFADALRARPSPRLASSICYLMTAITTFIVPLVPDNFLPGICDYIWNQHVKLTVPLAFDSAVDAITEFIIICGPAAAIQGADNSGSLLSMVSEQLDTVYVAAQQSGDLNSLFSILKDCIALIPSVLLGKSFLPTVFEWAFSTLQQSCQSTMTDLGSTRSVVLFYSAWFNLSVSLLGLDSEFESTAIRAAVAPQIWSISNSILPSLLFQSIAQIALGCNEVLVDALSALIHCLVRYAASLNQSDRSSGDRLLAAAATDELCTQFAAAIHTSANREAHQSTVVAAEAFRSFIAAICSCISTPNSAANVPSTVDFQDLGSKWWQMFQGKVSNDDFLSELHCKFNAS